MTRVLVTGGCGFIGCNLIDHLHSRGYDDVLVLDDESVGRRMHVGHDCDFIHADIRDSEAVDRAVAASDVVVHLAADTRVIDSIEDPQKNFDINVIGSLNVLNAMRRHGKRRIVNASTGGAIVGDVDPPVHEDMVPTPIAPYGAGKLAVEGYLSAFEGAYDLAPISLRFANVYGPRSFHKGSVVATFFKHHLRGEPLPVYGDGSQTRDFIFVRDLSKVIVDSLEHERTGVFQLGSGNGTSVNQLLRLMSQVVGEDLLAAVAVHPVRRGEVAQTWCAITKARTELGFEPSTSLMDGLAETWEWFKEHGLQAGAERAS